MKLFILIFTLIAVQINAYAIDLIIGGKTYYIEKFKIENNGKTLHIPYTIDLDASAYSEKIGKCYQKPKRSYATKTRTYRAPASRTFLRGSSSSNPFSGSYRTVIKRKKRPYKKNSSVRESSRRSRSLR